MSIFGFGSKPVVDPVVETTLKDTPNFFSRENLSISSKVTPQWLSSWEGKTLSEKISKVFIEIGRSILFGTFIIPLITFTADLIKNAVQPKKVAPEDADRQLELQNNQKPSTTKKIIGISLAVLLIAACVVIPPLALGVYPFMRSNPQPTGSNQTVVGNSSGTGIHNEGVSVTEGSPIIPETNHIDQTTSVFESSCYCPLDGESQPQCTLDQPATCFSDSNS
jgi:hypothetical protein